TELDLTSLCDPTFSACGFNNDISGTGSVHIINNSGVLFSGTNTYAGATVIDAGSLLLAGSAGAIPTQSDVIDNGTFELFGFDTTIGSLAGSGVVSTGPNTLNIGANNHSTVFSGVIDGGVFNGSSSNVNKIGTGTLTLSGAGNA